MSIVHFHRCFFSRESLLLLWLTHKISFTLSTSCLSYFSFGCPKVLKYGPFVWNEATLVRYETWKTYPHPEKNIQNFKLRFSLARTNPHMPHSTYPIMPPFHNLLWIMIRGPKNIPNYSNSGGFYEFSVAPIWSSLGENNDFGGTRGVKA